mmetsp:Transcript_13463/g.31617  ORF Transcript_13463/g.31617 Transcript_13463/m.31617 type:complete len:274 (-) Transcript_13463:25-846(-)
MARASPHAGARAALASGTLPTWSGERGAGAFRFPHAQSPGRWDLTQAPVLLAGADGYVHETRPTTSLARDLAESEAHEQAANRPEEPTRRSEEPMWRREDLSRRPDEQMRRPEEQVWRPAEAARMADRPLMGLGLATALRPRTSPGAPRRPRRSSYEPINELLSMGFDGASARAAIAAAGGDVDRAIRLVHEDLCAHEARSVGEWEFEGDLGWVPFDCASESVIKEALAKGASACEVVAGGSRYFLDFSSLTQLNLATQRSRKIRRRRDPGQQ